MNTLEQLVAQVETQTPAVTFQDQETESESLILWQKDLE